MGNSRLLNVVIKNYKALSNISIDLSNKKTCFIGDNGSGKTTILEALSSRKAIDVYANDVSVAAIYTVEFDVTNYNYGVDRVIIKLSQNSENFETAFLSIEGLDDYISKSITKVHNLEEEYEQYLRENVEILKDLETWVMDTQNKLDLNELRDFWDVTIPDLKLIQKEKQKFITYLESEKFKASTLFPNFYLRYEDRLNDKIDSNVFNITPLSDRQFKEFCTFFKDYSIEDDGFEYDWKKVEEKFSKIQNILMRLSNVVNENKDKYDTYSRDIVEKNGDLYEAVTKVKNIELDIKELTTGFIRNNYLLSSSDIHINSDIVKEFTGISKKVLNEFGVQFSSTKTNEFSDGEKWIYRFVEMLEEFDGKLLYIDEPSMFLNEKYYDRLNVVFDLLIEEGYQIIYTTHNPQLIPFESTDKVEIKEFDFSTVEGDIISYRDLIIMTTRTLLLVEGENDYLLFNEMLKRLNVNPKLLNTYDCKGHGIVQMISFCIENNFSFKAIVDLDKENDLITYLKDNYELYKNHIVLVGNENRKEIEGYMTNSDIEECCTFLKDKREHKMTSTMLKNVIENKIQLSNEFMDKIRSVFKQLEII